MENNQINDHSTNTANDINKTTTIGMLYTNKKIKSTICTSE